MVAFRQGDVLLREVPPIREGSALPDLVLARGETSGHSHRLAEGTAVLIENEHGTFLHVTSDSAFLVHEEHAPMELLRGYYEVLLQRSYDPTNILDSSD